MYEEHIIATVPEVLWSSGLQVCGSYQGDLYNVGIQGDKVYVYSGYYGSCGLCGSWWEGNAPSREDILGSCEVFDTVIDAVKYIAFSDSFTSYEGPDREALVDSLLSLTA